MYRTLVYEYFWFYGASIKYMSHQSKVKTFFQAIPKSFVFIKAQHKYHKTGVIE